MTSKLIDIAVEEGDFRDMAGVQTGGLANVSLPVREQKTSYFYLGAGAAKYVAGLAHDITKANVYTAFDGKINGIVCHLPSLDTRECQALYDRLRCRYERSQFCYHFEPDTKFSVVVLGNRHDVPHEIERIFWAIGQMGGEDFMVTRYIDLSEPLLLTDGIELWRRDFEANATTHQSGFYLQELGADRAYKFIDGRAGEQLSSGRGYVKQAVLYHRQGACYVASSPVKHVALKVVDITNFGSTLQLLVDNPYKEIYRLRELQNTEFVPKLFDAFESSSNLYMATEWASGGSLAEACKNPLSPQQSQNYYRRILRICRVLEYFHICHADLKPANIVIHNGQVLFIDWGMSFKYKTGSSLARSLGNIRFGTSAYMSPERFFCRPLFVGQIDCWAASLCLFSMMTGLPCMYEEPHPENFLFFYIYHAALLSRNPDDSIIERVELGLTEKITMAMRRLDRLALKIWRDTQKKWTLYRQRIHQLPMPVKELLGSSLSLNPIERLNYDEIMNHEWMINPA